MDKIDTAGRSLGFTPRLVVDGLIDRSLSPLRQRELLQAVDDCLASAASRGSSWLEVSVRAGAGELALVVQDDGRQPPNANPDCEWARMQARAQRLGRTCSVRPAAGNGLVVEWRVPLAD